MFNKLHTIYMLTALLWGIFMAFLIPPFRAPDESAHYFRAANLAEGKAIVCTNNSFEVSKQKTDFAYYFGIVKRPNLRPPDEIYPIDKKIYKDTESQTIDNIGTILCSSSPLGHTPHALGIFIGNKIGLNELYSFYASRIFGLICAVLITTISIKILPFGKTLLVGIGLLPMTIHQYSTVTYDAVLIPIIFLFIAYILFLKWRKKVLTKKDLLFILILCIPISLIKIGYQPILLSLLLLFDNKLFKKNTHFMLFLIVALVFCIALVLGQLFLFGKNLYVPDYTNPPEQLKLVIRNPSVFIIALTRSLIFQSHVIILTTLGVLGWHEYLLYPITYGFIFVSFTTFILEADLHKTFQKRERVILFGVSLATFLSICFAMYLISSPVGFSFVRSIFGRYIVPILFPFALSLLNSKNYVSNPTTRRHRTVVLILSNLAVIGLTLLKTYTVYYNYS